MQRGISLAPLTSIDSMVTGEAEIVRQMKHADHYAVDTGTSGPMLNRLFQPAFTVGSRHHHKRRSAPARPRFRSQ